MIDFPKTHLPQYLKLLENRGVPAASFAECIKWSRYFLDYCAKYPAQESEAVRVQLFLEKLKVKKQSDLQCRQAAYAVRAFLDVQKKDLSVMRVSSEIVDVKQGVSVEPAELPRSRPRPRASQYSVTGYEEKSSSPQWDEVVAKMAGEIRLRHYSRRTLQTYAQWSRQFQRFLKNKNPDELSPVDVKEYLTWLAVKCNVAASTQNQAFNSLLFLYRHGLHKDFGRHTDIPRAKKSLYIPVVLSRAEIDAILQHLSYPFNLAVNLLFGCGLRLFECLQLRVRDFNFDAGVLTVHGKGKKDRTVPIPESILEELKSQIRTVTDLHERDLADGYDGVFLDDSVEKKYPGSPKEESKGTQLSIYLIRSIEKLDKNVPQRSSKVH